jgi:hypothetical protein
MYDLTLWRVPATIVVVGKAMGTTYSECEFVALGTQHAMRMRRIVICSLSHPTVVAHIVS